MNHVNHERERERERERKREERIKKIIIIYNDMMIIQSSNTFFVKISTVNWESVRCLSQRRDIFSFYPYNLIDGN